MLSVWVFIHIWYECESESPKCGLFSTSSYVRRTILNFAIFTPAWPAAAGAPDLALDWVDATNPATHPFFRRGSDPRTELEDNLLDAPGKLAY